MLDLKSCLRPGDFGLCQLKTALAVIFLGGVLVGAQLLDSSELIACEFPLRPGLLQELLAVAAIQLDKDGPFFHLLAFLDSDFLDPCIDLGSEAAVIQADNSGWCRVAGVKLDFADRQGFDMYRF